MLVSKLQIFLLMFGPLGLALGQWETHGPSYEQLEEADKHLTTLSRHKRASGDGECEERYGGICPPPPPDPIPDYVSVAVKERDDELYRGVFKLLIERAMFYNGPEERVTSPFNFKKPEEILNCFDFKLGASGESHDKLIKHVEKLIDYSPKISHPYYLDRHHSGLDPYALAADWIMTILGSPMLTYLLTPVFTLAEIEISRAIKQIIGYPECQGDFAVTQFPQGYALQMALQHKYPRFKTDGHVKIGRPKSVIFLSDQSGYLVEKHAIFQGVGQDNVIRIRTDDYGRMDCKALVDALEDCKNKDWVPVMLVANIGTPILGAIDPINKMADIAKKYDMWFHIDGTIGGPLIFSNDKLKLLKGIEKSDSVTIGAHYLLNAPIEGSIIVTRHKDIMIKTFGVKFTSYVYKTTVLTKEKWDLGDHTFHTCRRSDTFKFWYMWKAKGRIGLGNHIDYTFKNARIATGELLAREGRFKLILPRFEMPVVSFYYIHPSLRIEGSECHETDAETIRKLSALNEDLKNKLLLDGVLQISISKSLKKNVPDFLTMKLSNSAINKDVIYSILDSIEECGDKIIDKDCGKCVRRECSPPKSYPSFVSAPIESMHKHFFERLVEIIMCKAVYFQDKRNEPPIKFRTPENLQKIINFTLGNNGIVGEDKLLGILDQVIEYSAKQSHPYWIYQLFAGLDPYTQIAEIITSTLSSPQITYENNPVLTVMEKETGKTIRNRLGEGWEGADVVFPFGGSMGNTIPIYLARYRTTRDLQKRKGYASQSKIFRIYTNRHSHYSFIKGAYFTGIGHENCVFLTPDNRDRVNVTDLRCKIEADLKKGYVPIYIGISAGHTVSGAVDPVDKIMDICDEYGLWCHVDGTFGGSFFLSDNQERQDSILKGFRRANSFTFNPTKMLGATMLITCLTVKQPGLIKDGLKTNSYINFSPRSKLYDKAKWDFGDSYLESFRSAKVLKIWLLWRARGNCGITKHLEHVMENAQFAIAEMKRRSGCFQLMMPNFDLTNVLFMYIPKRIQHMNRKSEEFYDEIEKVSFKIQAEMVRHGVMVIVAQRVADEMPLLLKFVLFSSGLTRADILYLIDQVDRHGKNL